MEKERRETAQTESIQEDRIVEEQKKESVSYTITEDVHTKTSNKIWVVKPEKKLERKDFEETKRKLAILQGFYSSFKKGFIFKYDPTEKLKLVNLNYKRE